MESFYYGLNYPCFNTIACLKRNLIYPVTFRTLMLDWMQCRPAVREDGGEGAGNPDAAGDQQL